MDLAAAIEACRAKLEKAREEGVGKSIQFSLEPIELSEPLFVRQKALNAVQTLGLSVKRTSASRKLWAH